MIQELSYDQLNKEKKCKHLYTQVSTNHESNYVEKLIITPYFLLSINLQIILILFEKLKNMQCSLLKPDVTQSESLFCQKNSSRVQELSVTITMKIID